MTPHRRSQLPALLVRLEGLVHPASLILRRSHLRTPQDSTKDPYQMLWALTQENSVRWLSKTPGPGFAAYSAQAAAFHDLESYTFHRYWLLVVVSVL
jgi:hypothetical protein